ncbi:uncharacterized protein LOC111704054 [Eurytemora carolleeae]|uniref:uncharacterized protein LOC111704054 n=1 Tax=Eurytemora carolleeae TaxID=1294199 RepID=UPI000C773DB0|nr:uncharacterized protein LOC111704054 [Eurytemora carolleeae]|eukprot:XP_023331944.1 uncharacterized protein LOC111704054 [Eurytemora affinis]
MLATGMTGLLARRATIISKRRYSVEVMVSQSSNLLSNTALEEWIRRNMNFKQKNLLLLSSSLSNKGRNIKACFLGEAGLRKDTQANLVFQSIPRDAVLTQLPEICLEDGEGSIRVSVPLENNGETSALNTIQNIAEMFIRNERGEDEKGSGCRLSLVRPDHGWFPGIEDIEKELEMNLAEIQSIQREKKANRSAVV